MTKLHRKTLFIFRRDLRLEDNLGLIEALCASEKVIPCFIFDSRQIKRETNPYFSEPAFYFMLQSLAELNESLRARSAKLYIFQGNPAKVVYDLITKDDVDAVYTNKDYTPFSTERDQEIATACKTNKVSFASHRDCTLSSLETVRTNEDKIYTVFTPFMKKASQQVVAKPRKNNFSNYFSQSLNTKTEDLSKFKADIGKRELILKGGRNEALAIWRRADFLQNYDRQRNYLAKIGTSRLSAHHKFGTISIRETYAKATAKNRSAQFINELYWRDFYYYIAYHFPAVFKQSFLPWAKYIKWRNDKKDFQAWCSGQTGVPIVDAGMRELNHTGWIHNRSRMVIASYLTKNLLIDWRWGEQYFAQNLIDYDPAQNNGGWQWSASTGADPRPLRIFNPYTQASNYDTQGEYMKKWLPELNKIDSRILSDGKTQDFSTFSYDYPAPIVDQKESYHRAKEVYRQAKAAYSKKEKN